MNDRKPQRIQQRRTAGWRKPAGAVVVSRPSRWGNPFRAGYCYRQLSADWKVFSVMSGPLPGHTLIRDTAHAVALFREYATARLTWEPAWLAPLRGKDVCCFCAEGKPCHGDALVELANL